MMKGKHPTAHFGCMKDRCMSPLACSTFGFCRELNFIPASRPICIGCLKRPDELEEYRSIVIDEGDEPTAAHCDRYVRAEEGTYNEKNGHFLCTPCYQAAGEPTAPRGWIAP